MIATMSVINRHTNISTQPLTASRIGNILSKTGLGSYTYGSSKPHAVTGVENTGGIIPQTSQNITYNAFGKVCRIESGGYTLDIDYGSDRQRWRSTVTDSLDNIVRSIRYCEDEELVTMGDSTLVVLYFDGGIVYVRGKNSPQSSSRFYQITADRLGSVLNLSDNQGNKIFTRSYDAWGKPGNWNLGWFQHGYTVHEMLPEFGLINMNGRVYDPVLGRFLSPDDYVQMPLSPQGFNRYTYCNNNPLKYTDPSGELFGLSVFTGLLKGIGKFIKHGKIGAIFDESIKSFNNDLRLTSGLFRGNFNQIFSRFTYESLQTTLGLLASDFRINFNSISCVDFYDGATYIIREKGSKSFTLGSFININSKHPIPMDDEGHFKPFLDPLYMHEYGHYIQSQKIGFIYLFKVAIPSAWSLLMRDTHDEHVNRWPEKDASKKAANYFQKEGVDWKNDKYNYKTYFSLYPF